MQSRLYWADLGLRVSVQVVEKRTRSMEDEICQLHKKLEERNYQLEAFASDANRVRFTALSICILFIFCICCSIA